MYTNLGSVQLPKNILLIIIFPHLNLNLNHPNYGYCWDKYHFLSSCRLLVSVDDDLGSLPTPEMSSFARFFFLISRK